MVDLTKYGFKKIIETENYDDYEGHDFLVTIYHYHMKQTEGQDYFRNVFVVNSKRFMSKARPVNELEDWLKEKNISEVK